MMSFAGLAIGPGDRPVLLQGLTPVLSFTHAISNPRAFDRCFAIGQLGFKFTEQKKADIVERVMVLAEWLLQRLNQVERVNKHIRNMTLPPTSIQRDVDSDGWFCPSGRGERRGLAWSWPLSAAPDPVAG